MPARARGDHTGSLAQKLPSQVINDLEVRPHDLEADPMAPAWLAMRREE